MFKTESYFFLRIEKESADNIIMLNIVNNRFANHFKCIEAYVFLMFSSCSHFREQEFQISQAIKVLKINF